MRAKLSAPACNALLNVRRARSYFFAAVITCVPIAAAQAWERPHSDGPNSGFADVETVLADAPRTIPSIGTFAPGAGPVIAASGTVYLANQQGQVMSLQPDGTRGWTQQITPGFTIVASPVVDSQGAVYVVGSRTVRNTQVNPPLIRHDSALYKFSPDGNLLWRTLFPNHDDGPTTSAPANIWKSGGVEVLMTPVYYPNRVTGGYDGRLVAISRDGSILDDRRFVTMLPSAIPDVDYGGKPRWCVVPLVGLMCELMPDFNPSGNQSGIDPATRLPKDTIIPRPGVAVFTYDSPGTPFILVTDQQQDLAAYTFVNNRFNEVFRVDFDRQWYQSPPTVLRDGHTLIAKRDLEGYGTLFFVGPNMQSVPQIAQIQSFAAPTQLADGRVAIVGHDLKMTILSSANRVERAVPLPGQSMVSAAASRTHLFVSTAGSFLTYDLNTWEKKAEIFWVGGGTVTPAIGPFGHVYGMASNVLFVFPPPVPNQVGPLVANPDGPLVADPSPSAATPASKRYNGPVTNAGHRLFACQALDGDDCGKSTNKAIALTFCQQQGFTQITKVDTETKRVKAARLDGQFCTKDKCKVFDEIVCKK